MILRIIGDPVRPLRSGTVLLALSDLLQAALAKEPEDRPGTAIEFARALSGARGVASGWPPTAYVVWGQSGSDPASTDAGPLPAAPVAAISPTVVATEPPDRLYPRAPSVAVPDVARQRPTWPGWGAPAVQSPALVVRPAPMILHRRGPSVSAPAGQGRNVVVPDQLGRGPQQHQPLVAPNPPLLPLGAAARPVSRRSARFERASRWNPIARSSWTLPLRLRQSGRGQSGRGQSGRGQSGRGQSGRGQSGRERRYRDTRGRRLGP